MKTAVDWLIDMLVTENEITLKGENYKLFDQAKEMEKQQIKDSFVECWKSNVPDGIECKLDAEAYYNQTFKSE
jgi:hypothetical protein